MDELKRLRIMCTSHMHAHEREARWVHLSQVLLVGVMGAMCVPSPVWLHLSLGVVGVATLCLQIFGGMNQRCMQFYANSVCLNRYLEAMVIGIPERHARFGGWLPHPSPDDVRAASEVVSSEPAAACASDGESIPAASGLTHTPITLQPA